MTAITTDLSTAGQEVWVQKDGLEAMRLICEPHTKLMDDLKRMVFPHDREYYQAFHRGQYLRPGGLIPTDTSGEEPIQLKRIDNRRFIGSNDNDDDAGMGIPLPAYDERKTRIMHDKRQMAPKCNKRMNKLQSNYDPDVADTVSDSRDCLLSTSTNSSGGWTFHGPLWQAASTLWRRMTNGSTTSYKSKSD